MIRHYFDIMLSAFSLWLLFVCFNVLFFTFFLNKFGYFFNKKKLKELRKNIVIGDILLSVFGLKIWIVYCVYSIYIILIIEPKNNNKAIYISEIHIRYDRVYCCVLKSKNSIIVLTITLYSIYQKAKTSSAIFIEWNNLFIFKFSYTAKFHSSRTFH